MQMATQDRIDGFSLLEIVLVIFFISLFAAIAALRQPQTDVSVQASAEVLKAHMRYAQMRAMNTNNSWGIRYLKSTGRYGLVRSDDINTYHFLPGEIEKEVDLSAKGIVINPGDFYLSFDDWGIPTIVGDGTLSMDSGSAAIQLAKDGELKDIIITALTGFIQ